MAVQYVAGLVKVAPSELVKNEWPSRAIKYHRARIRAALLLPLAARGLLLADIRFRHRKHEARAAIRVD